MGLENTSGERKINIRLRRARASHLWPIKTAARAVGVDISTYTRWEQGKQCPQLVNLQALCDAFKLPPEELGYENREGEVHLRLQEAVEKETEVARGGVPADLQ